MCWMLINMRNLPLRDWRESRWTNWREKIRNCIKGLHLYDFETAGTLMFAPVTWHMPHITAYRSCLHDYSGITIHRSCLHDYSGISRRSRLHNGILSKQVSHKSCQCGVKDLEKKKKKKYFHNVHHSHKIHEISLKNKSSNQIMLPFAGFIMYLSAHSESGAFITLYTNTQQQ